MTDALITGVSGFATALSNDATSPLNKIFKTPKTLYISPNTNNDVDVSVYDDNLAFMRESIIQVGSGATLHIGSGTTLRTNAIDLFSPSPDELVVTDLSVTGSVTSSLNLTGVGGSITVGETFLQSNSITIGSTDNTGRDAGIGTAAGTLIFNSGNDLRLELYTGIGWTTVFNSGSGEVTGGTVTSHGSYTYHDFTEPGSLTVTGSYLTGHVLMIGGGGGGGRNVAPAGGAGAGGAGGVVAAPFTLGSGTYPIIVGAGGAGGGGTNMAHGVNGTPSTFNGLVALGGGRGLNYSPNPGAEVTQGGSPGGRYGQSISPLNQTNDPAIPADSRTYGYGNQGAAPNPEPDYGGGGGGGGGADASGKSGGIGLPTNDFPWLASTPFFSSTSQYFAGGGGGTGRGAGPSPTPTFDPVGMGGTGGGGAGSNRNGTGAQNGEQYTGGGGGAAAGPDLWYTYGVGNGGDGRVIIVIPT